MILRILLVLMFSLTSAFAAEYERIQVNKCWKLKKALPSHLTGMTIPSRICVELMDVQMTPNTTRGNKVTLFGKMEIAGAEVSLFDTYVLDESRDHDSDFNDYTKELLTVYGRNENPANNYFNGPVRFRLWMHISVNNEYENRVSPSGVGFTGLVSTMGGNLVVWDPEFVEE